MRAFARFQQTHGDCRLRVVGEGPERPALEQLATSLAVDNVEFAGAVAPERAREELIGSSVILIPSTLPEGFGLVAAEAALARRPVIASRVEGLDEVVLDAVTGLLVCPGSPPALEEAMHRVAGDYHFASCLADAAYARAQGLYSLTVCAETYNEAYQKALRKFMIQSPDTFRISSKEIAAKILDVDLSTGTYYSTTAWALVWGSSKRATLSAIARGIESHFSIPAGTDNDRAQTFLGPLEENLTSQARRTTRSHRSRRTNNRCRL